MARAWAGVKGLAATARAVAEAKWRWLSLCACRLSGELARLTSRAWPRTAGAVLLVVVVLTLGPVAIDKLSALAGHLGLWSLLGTKAPHVGHWLNLLTLLVGLFSVFVVHSVTQARRRVVVEDFVDYTSDAAKAVSGLSTLVVSELSRLRVLYQHVNDQLSISTSVGVTRRGDTGSAAEAGSFLSVRADEMSDMLSSAVASEAQIQIGVVRIPIGTVLLLFGRLVKGPRMLGSVHLTDAGGGPMLTAQIVGRNPVSAWRVDISGTPASTVNRAYLDPMVTELACRMFTDLTLRGSVRWRAIEHFTEYLRLYSESQRTPKHRAPYLRQAEGALLEAIAEDEAFSLAFYNLGVIYSQLAETERRGAAAGGLGKPTPVKQETDPEYLHQARVDAAVAAFQQALELDPGRWDAVYALAVHRYTQVEEQLIDATNGEPAEQPKELKQRMERVLQLCDRAIDLDRGNAQAHDLRGLANRRLVELEPDCDLADARLVAAMSDHRAAVRLSWRRLCQAEYAERASPPTADGVLSKMQANASAALRNLAVAYQLRAHGKKSAWRWLRFWRSDFIFGQALSLAPATTLAATQVERGAMREEWDRAEAAAKPYRLATKIDRDNPVYWALLARAHAIAWHERKRDPQKHERIARESATWALQALAPIFRRALEPFPLRATIRLRDSTLAALERVYRELGDASNGDQIRRIVQLARTLPDAGAEELDGLERSCGSDWERFQVKLVNARLLESRRDWAKADERYRDLIEHPLDGAGVAMSEPMLRVRRAKVLRKHSKSGQAPEEFPSQLLREGLGQAARALLTDPLNPSVRREVGKSHFALGQYAEALDIWNHTLALTPNDPYLCFKMGLCHWHLAQDRYDRDLRLEQLAGARSCFDHACLLFGLERIEQWTWSQLWRGRTELEQGDLDRSVCDLRSAVSSADAHLAASVLLADAYRRGGDEAVSHRWFRHALSELSTPRNCVFLDAGWGNTLSCTEALAWAGCAVAMSSASEDSAAERLRLLEDALAAARKVPDDRARARWTASCLDAQGQIRSQDDLVTAVKAVEQAGGLCPSPEIILHLLELYEAQAKRQRDPDEWLKIIKQAEHAVRKLKRLDAHGEAMWASDATEILARLRALPPPAGTNGGARWRRVLSG